MPRRPLNSNLRSVSPRAPDRPRLAGAILLAAVRGYQLLLRPLWPQSCRFHPSCSEYAREAVARYGALRGSGLALRRLGRCHPGHPGGWDPVPSGKT